ncbi:nuclear transport factor 2 family protein [Pseudonocardia sp. D17]|uniref:nuclear transport factor 2 family protein n=1 Tax=Pseudonocardia sp. D17 TaxID=882661 RepID=UPI002B3912CA|nr:hypothetical protein PSD17_24530 [Pseudonocardia sp. D17]
MTDPLLDPRLPDQRPLAAEAEAVRTVVLAERTAKDLGRWEVMAALFVPDSRVAVSWFHGSGADFVAGARARSARGGSPSFHEIGAVSVLVREDRALADAGCAVHVRGALDGVVVDVVSRGRLTWRVVRQHDGWRIAGMDMIYLRDAITPVEPGAALRLPDPAPGDREAYRHLGLLLSAAGQTISADLPGTDRPESIEALLAEQRHWFFS